MPATTVKLASLLTPDRVAWNIQANSKKRALEILSELLAKGATPLSQGEIFTSIVNRERLGSTGVGKGLAIPHGRVKGLDSAVGALIRLSEPTDYGSNDQQPVDMLFGLLVPENCGDEHLQALARVAELFNDERLTGALRAAHSGKEAFAMLSAARETRRATG